MTRPTVFCVAVNVIAVVTAAFIFLFYIFHETKGSAAKEMNVDEIEKFRHHRRLLPASEHFANISLIEQHYCPMQQSSQCSLKAFSFCGNNSRSVSLTFDVDQSWTKKNIDGIIEELKGVQIPATFFMTGQEPIDHEDRCEQAQALVRAGHEVQIMAWDGAELLPNQPIEALQVDRAVDFFRDCLGSSRSLQPVEFRPIKGQITLEQARAVSQRYHVVIAMWSLSSEPDRVEHLLELADSHIENNESIVIRCQDPEYWSQAGPLGKFVYHFHQEQYEFVQSRSCYEQCGSELCLAPYPRS